MTAKRHYPVIIIGAGQAGLTMAYLLQSAGVEYLLIGRESRIGDTWRQRYDSLRLFTPRWMNCLPDQSVEPGRDPNGYPGKDEIADDLETYAQQHQLNIQLETRVLSLLSSSDAYDLETSQGNFSASSIVVATGPFQNPAIPNFATALSANVNQIHTADYRNPQQLKDGPVLIVGCGNSGAQIAVELAECHDGEVHLSAGDTINFVPQNILGKSIFWWFKYLGVYKANINTFLGRRLSQRGDPVIGKELQACLRSGKVQLHPRSIAAVGDRVRFEDGSEIPVSNIIWATGFVPGCEWLQVPGVLTEEGRPLHRRGITKAPGIYFLGLPWQYNRASALIGGVATDARHILAQVLEQKPAAQLEVASPV